MTDGVEMSLTGVDEWMKALDLIVARATAAALEIVTGGAQLVVREAMSSFQGSHARGQPHVGGAAPNVVTGTTRRSIRMISASATGPGSAAAFVGPTVRWGRRLEKGFDGRDKLGRVYQQRPYPFMTPGLQRARAAYLALARDTWSRSFRG